ncbi:hypothetical protein VTK73DRAFT_4576 [Phialemonium thermophilum]|uniref:Uncharacterized protein n=1 Tax=Phialemonium thermophilum TaxID=223376 RepID=A0ABR3V7I8_9PEZI
MPPTVTSSKPKEPATKVPSLYRRENCTFGMVPWLNSPSKPVVKPHRDCWERGRVGLAESLLTLFFSPRFPDPHDTNALSKPNGLHPDRKEGGGGGGGEQPTGTRSLAKFRHVNLDRTNHVSLEPVSTLTGMVWSPTVMLTT